MSAPRVALVFLICINLLCFTLMGIDKRRAKHKAWRISERALMLCAAAFGALGAMAGMLAFRHKTQHAKFAIGLPILLAAQIVLLLLAFRALAPEG